MSINKVCARASGSARGLHSLWCHRQEHDQSWSLYTVLVVLPSQHPLHSKHAQGREGICAVPEDNHAAVEHARALLYNPQAVCNGSSSCPRHTPGYGFMDGQSQISAGLLPG